MTFVPFLLKGVALNPSYNLDDGKHPNPEGVKLISKSDPVFFAVLRKMVRFRVLLELFLGLVALEQ